MSLAIELKRAGLDVRIIDKSNHPALHSQALVIQARTLEQFQRYGIAQKTIDAGRKLARARFQSEGKSILSFEFNRIPSRYNFVLLLPQNQTEAILNDHMQSLGLKIERETQLTSLSQQNGNITCALRHADGREEQLSPRWIVGCDGAHSAVRSACSIPFEGKGIGLSFFLGDLELDGPDVPSDELVLHLHDGNVVFLAKLTDKLTRLIVAIHAQPHLPQNHTLTIQDFQQAIDQANLRVKIRSAEWITPFNVRDLQAKHYRAGSAFLAGDAAHIHSPVAGQGMNTGIQDAANLGWKLAAVARGGTEKLLDSYEEERRAVGKALLDRTERGLKLATTANPFIEYLRDTLAPLITKPQIVQDAAVGFISETAINYRSSSIVSNLGGDGTLKAGDRLPDLNTTQPRQPTLLQSWTTPNHLALFINTPQPQVQQLTQSLHHTDTITIETSALDPHSRKLFGEEPKLLLTRPDGYIGLKTPLTKSPNLTQYTTQHALRA
jgi:2-polyprenyl-6-methoxyphenol hydroxylase-like FAD-dependent oxidoreductase